MKPQELQGLYEAYLEVYNELDEAAKRSPKKVRGSKDTKSYQDGRSQAGMMVSGDSQVSGAGYMRRGGGIQTQTDPNERQPQQGRMDRYTRDEMEYRKARLKKEETDLYDIILSHLLDEGYADTEQAAEVIMVNMSEEWRESIVEERRQSPRPTVLPRSRERDIGPHDDWKDKPLDWSERQEKGKKLRRRAQAVVGTRRREDKETGVYEEFVDESQNPNE